MSSELHDLVKARLSEGAWTEDFDRILNEIAFSGDCGSKHEWSTVQELIKTKLIKNIWNHQFSYGNPIPEQRAIVEAMTKHILSSIELFNDSPFTIQRICELIQTPTQSYSKNVFKYLRAIERSTCVISPSKIFRSTSRHSINRLSSDTHDKFNIPTTVSTNKPLQAFGSQKASDVDAAPLKPPRKYTHQIESSMMDTD